MQESASFSLLAAPGGKGGLRFEQDSLVAEDGRRFAIVDGIVRMLDGVDAQLMAELLAQEAATGLYLNDRLLMTRYEPIVARLAVEELLGETRGAILDAGCGVGLLGRLYPQLGLYGADASMPLLSHARSGYRLLVECNAEALPFQDGSFDAVLAVNMLHHVIHPGSAVSEFARVLKPGGVLVAVDPREVAPIEVAKRVLRRGDSAFAETHKAFRADEYEQLIRASGCFEVEAFRQVGLAALLLAGGLDALSCWRWMPAAVSQVLLDGAVRADRLLSALAPARRLGLNLFVRARRR